jgi:hypothetical protein
MLPGAHARAVGHCVWTQDKLVSNPNGKLEMVVGRFLVGRVASGTPVSFSGHEPLEASTIVGYRWLSHAEILAREADETFLPPGLGALPGNVLNDAVPTPVSLTR